MKRRRRHSNTDARHQIRAGKTRVQVQAIARRIIRQLGRRRVK